MSRRVPGSAVPPQVERDHLDRRIEGEQPLDDRVERGGGLGDAVDEHHGRSRTPAAPARSSCRRRTWWRCWSVASPAHDARPSMPGGVTTWPSPITSERASASPRVAYDGRSAWASVVSSDSLRAGPLIDDDGGTAPQEDRSQLDTDGCDPMDAATPPGKIGLYDPRHEHDSCGVSFVANLHGVRSNELVRTGLTALTNLEHRGATGAEADTGDGAGILLQVPDALYRAVVAVRSPCRRALRHRHRVPAHRRRRLREGDRRDRVDDGRRRARGRWVGGNSRSIPTCLGATALAAMPRFRQLFVSRSGRRDAASTSIARRSWPASGLRRELDGRTRHLLRVVVVPHGRLQGDAHHAPAERVLPRSDRRPRSSRRC